MENTVS